MPENQGGELRTDVGGVAMSRKSNSRPAPAWVCIQRKGLTPQPRQVEPPRSAETLVLGWREGELERFFARDQGARTLWRAACGGQAPDDLLVLRQFCDVDLLISSRTRRLSLAVELKKEGTSDSATVAASQLARNLPRAIEAMELANLPSKVQPVICGDWTIASVEDAKKTQAAAELHRDRRPSLRILSHVAVGEGRRRFLILGSPTELAKLAFSKAGPRTSHVQTALARVRGPKAAGVKLKKDAASFARTWTKAYVKRQESEVAATLELSLRVFEENLLLVVEASAQVRDCYLESQPGPGGGLEIPPKADSRVRRAVEDYHRLERACAQLSSGWSYQRRVAQHLKFEFWTDGRSGPPSRRPLEARAESLLWKIMNALGWQPRRRGSRTNR